VDAYWGFHFLFKERSIKRIVMNYPDPWFKKSHESKRLTGVEHLYVYGKKLKQKGEIRIRTDDYAFVEFTLEGSALLDCYSAEVLEPIISMPLTKYEKRWLSMGKKIWDVFLVKEREPKPIRVREVKEVRELFPVKVADRELKIGQISRKEFVLRPFFQDIFNA